MKNLSKIFITLLLVCTFASSVTYLVNATTSGGNVPPPASSTPTRPNTVGLTNPLNANSIGQLVNDALDVFVYLVILFAVLAFIWVGLQYILARGNSERMKELSKWLGYIVIGVAIVIGAKIMVNIVINTLESTGQINPNIIQSARNASGN